MTRPPTTHYDTLGLASDASADELERAFRRRAFETHPDHNPDDPKAAAEQFRAVRAAYDILRDPARRARYDAALAAAATPRPARPARPAGPPPRAIVIRKGRPQASDVPTGLVVGLVEGFSRSILVATGLVVVSFIGSALVGWLVAAIIAVDVLVVGLLIRYLRTRRARLAAQPVTPTGEVRFTLDADGLHDVRRDVRLPWEAVRGYVVSWPEDWMDLTLVREAVPALPRGAAEIRGDRYVYRLDLKGTDGELVDVEKLLQHVLHRAR